MSTDARLLFRGIRPLQKLGATARRLTFSNPFSGLVLAAKRVPSVLTVVPSDPWPGDAVRGRDMIAGVFRFAGQTISRDDLSWNPEGAQTAWRAELHSFSWLRDLRSVGGERARRMAREMVINWIDQHEKYDAFAWRPDITGQRITAWIAFHDFFCASADDAFRKAYFESLVRQAVYLSKVVPGDTLGIPLMHALKGLAYAGLTLDCGEDWLSQAFSGIRAQVAEQVLPDGGHVSRNPQATFAFLQCLVDLRVALGTARLPTPEMLQTAIDRVAPAVKFFRQGDGALAHFNGGQEGNVHLCDTILMQAGARGRAPQSLPQSGYERITRGRASVIVDTGLPVSAVYGRDAHAGLLSFEFAFGRERVIVNCGASSVNASWKRVLRSTPAHSTLCLDSRNACEFDAEGRMSARPTVRAERHDDGDISLVEASHNGYLQHVGLMHHRCVRLRENGNVLSGEDQLTGKESAPFAVRFHLHPAMTVTDTPDGLLVASPAGTKWIFRAEGAEISVEESVYAGRDTQTLPTQQIVLAGQTADTVTTVSWEMRRVFD